ncbi:MAG: major royal jelly family protein, partial [Phycisphaerales bacterium]|nr:major royal jelly family protein [Phycisphaerales bacterium]
PGNIAVAPNGKIFISMHPFGDPKGPRIMEVDPATGKVTPLAQDWAGPINPQTGAGISAIIGIKVSRDGTLWLLDAGQPAEALKPGGNPLLGPKLYAIDTATMAARDAYVIPLDAVRPGSFIQDLAIDLTRQTIYLADCGIGQGMTDPVPAIIVLDLQDRSARRMLERHPALMPEPDASMIIDGTEVRVIGPDNTPMPARVGINPITISDDDSTVYFGSMHGRTIWRVPASSLASRSLGDRTLAQRLVRHGPKGVSDGFSIDSAGNIYVTDVNNNAIGILDQQGHYRHLARRHERRPRRQLLRRRQPAASPRRAQRRHQRCRRPDAHRPLHAPGQGHRRPLTRRAGLGPYPADSSVNPASVRSVRRGRP